MKIALEIQIFVYELQQDNTTTYFRTLVHWIPVDNYRQIADSSTEQPHHEYNAARVPRAWCNTYLRMCRRWDKVDQYMDEVLEMIKKKKKKKLNSL